MIEPKLFKTLYNLEHKPIKTYKYDLYLYKKFLKLFSSPQKDIGKIIHIAGTNGKGSVAGLISQILIDSGYRVGTYTSPHIKYVNERIRINNRMISDFLFKKYESLIYEKIKDKGKNYRTFFEAITTLAFLFFKDKRVDFSVIETGLGGLLDSTNVVDSSISVITKIDYDHTHIFGKSLKEISYQKAGIIKKNSVCFTFDQKKDVIEVLKNVAKKQNSELFIVDIKKFKMMKNGFEYKKEFYRFNLLYRYQIENAILAIEVSKFLNLKDRNIKQGIENFKIEGRLEIVKKRPTIIIDGSHNPSAIETTLIEIKRVYPKNFLTTISIFMSDKNYLKSIEILKKYSSKVILTQIDFFRCARINDYDKIEGIKKYKSIEEIFRMEKFDKNDVIIFIGSFYFIDKVKNFVKKFFLKK